MKTLHSLLAIGCLTGAATAQTSIFLDIGSGNSIFGVPSSGYAAAAPMGGVWNEVDTASIPGTNLFMAGPFVDSNGAMTGVTMTWDALGNGFSNFDEDEPNTTLDDEALIDDIAFAGGASEMRIDGLPAGNYDVYTYAMAPDVATFLTSVEVVGSPNGIQDVGGDFSSGFAQGTTHGLHSTTVAMGQSLTIMFDVSSGCDSINGVQIVSTDQAGGPGMNFCGPANQNSGGGSAVISATGSAIVADNDLTMTCSNMPPLVFGFFITSTTQGFVANPGGSAGNLCLGGSIGRYVGPGQIMNSGAQGSFSLAIDLTSVPQPLGPVSVQAGETWNWQTWFRDSSMGVATSNFSDGVQIDFL